MASARGLATLTSGLLSAVSAQRCTPCSLRASICPLLTQVRHRNQKKTRFKAPAEPKQKEKWTKKAKQKLVTVTKAPRHSEVFLARVPVDDVWIRAHYPRPKFSLQECLERHKEFADPSMLDNMEGFVYADMQLDLKTNKKNKFLPGVKGTVLLPHQFDVAVERKIAVFCKEEKDMAKAQSLGATYVGCADLIKMMLDGLLDKDDVDVFLCTPDVITDLIPVRSHLKDKFPNKAKGSIGSDIEEMWALYTKGVAYTSDKASDEIGKVQVPVGQLKMTTEQLAANFMAYIHDMCQGRPKNLGPLITEVFLVAPPSNERFLLQVEDYVPGYKKTAAAAAVVEEVEEEVKQEEESDSEEEEEEKA